jgi:hypothetical protein
LRRYIRLLRLLDANSQHPQMKAVRSSTARRMVAWAARFQTLPAATAPPRFGTERRHSRFAFGLPPRHALGPSWRVCARPVHGRALPRGKQLPLAGPSLSEQRGVTFSCPSLSCCCPVSPSARAADGHQRRAGRQTAAMRSRSLLRLPALALQIQLRPSSLHSAFL